MSLHRMSSTNVAPSIYQQHVNLHEAIRKDVRSGHPCLDTIFVPFVVPPRVILHVSARRTFTDFEIDVYVCSKPFLGRLRKVHYLASMRMERRSKFLKRITKHALIDDATFQF